MSMIGIDPEETAEALERDPGHQGAADLIRQMAARIAELEAQSETVSPASARLLDCGLCYEEQGEEVHPHPECPIGRAAVPAGQTPATDQTCDGCGHRLHAANLCPAVTYAEPCVCDEGAPATGQTAPVDRATAELATARDTNRRLNLRAQRLESELAAYRRAVGQWEISDRGTYIPHSSLRAIGLASGKDILGSVRHLKHFERVEQAEAAIERVRLLHDNLVASAELTSPDDPITRGAAAKRIAAALDGWTDLAAASAVVVRRATDETPGEAQLPFIHVDDDGDQLDIGAVMASTYDGEAPVVYVAAEQHQGDTLATVYVRPERVDAVIAALRSARLAAETLPAADQQQPKEA